MRDSGLRGALFALAMFSLPLICLATTPSVQSVSPSGGSGTDQTFTVSIQDTSGWQDVNRVMLMFTDGGCIMEVFPASGQTFLMTSDGNSWLGPNAGLDNSKCRVDAASAGGSGTNGTASFSVHFYPAFPCTQSTY